MSIVQSVLVIAWIGDLTGVVRGSGGLVTVVGVAGG